MTVMVWTQHEIFALRLPVWTVFTVHLHLPAVVISLDLHEIIIRNEARQQLAQVCLVFWVRLEWAWPRSQVEPGQMYSNSSLLSCICSPEWLPHCFSRLNVLQLACHSLDCKRCSMKLWMHLLNASVLLGTSVSTLGSTLAFRHKIMDQEVLKCPRFYFGPDQNSSRRLYAIPSNL